MRILFINSLKKNRWGGGEKWMIEASSGLIKRGHECTIGCREGSVIESKAIQNNVPVTKFNIAGDFDIPAIFRLKNILQKLHIDVLVCCQNKDVKIGGFAARQAGISAIFSRQGLQLFKNKKRYKYPFTKLIDGIITNTQSIKDIYESFGWFKPGFIHVVYNGISTPDTSERLTKDEVFRVHEDTKLVFSAGRLSEQKGFKYLIEAVNQCRQQGLNLHLFIAGTGKLKAELENLTLEKGLEKSVTFLGFLEDLSPYYQTADVFVLSSLYEGMPNVVMESMANGTPAIATKVNGSSELIKHGENGFLIDSKSTEQICDTLISYFKNENAKKVMGTAAQKHVKTHFSVDKMCEHLETIFANQLKKTQ